MRPILIAGLVLIGVGLGVSPSAPLAIAQPLAPHVIFGIVTDKDGDVLEGFRVEVLLDGIIAGTTRTDNQGIYALQLSSAESGRLVHLMFESVVSGPGVRLVDGFFTQIDYRRGGGTQRTVVLHPGFNLVQWTGTQITIELATVTIRERFSSVIGWDANRQRFQFFTPGGPPSINGLLTLQSGEAFGIVVPGSQLVVWEMPLTEEPSPITLVAGWNLVPWNGSHNRSVDEAFLPLATRIRHAFGWHAETGRYCPLVPSFLREELGLNPQTLPKHDAFWILITGGQPVQWPQP